MSEEDCCDQPKVWGGMSYVPHTDEYHRLWKGILKDAMRRRLLQMLGRRMGHTVQIMFTTQSSWYQCGCGQRGQDFPHSAAARQEGLEHLYAEGYQAHLKLSYGAVEGLCRFCGHKWHGWLLCGNRFDWTTCQCGGKK